MGCSSPRAPLEGSFRVWPSGSLTTRPRGLSHATPLGGCYVVVRGPSPAHAGSRVTPDRQFAPHITHLRARVSRDRGQCLATPSGHGGETPLRGSFSAGPWGPASDFQHRAWTHGSTSGVSLGTGAYGGHRWRCPGLPGFSAAPLSSPGGDDTCRTRSGSPRVPRRLCTPP